MKLGVAYAYARRARHAAHRHNTSFCPGERGTLRAKVKSRGSAIRRRARAHPGERGLLRAMVARASADVWRASESAGGVSLRAKLDQAARAAVASVCVNRAYSSFFCSCVLL